MKFKLVPTMLVLGDMLAIAASFVGGYVIAERFSTVFLTREFMEFDGGYVYPWFYLYSSVLIGSVLLFFSRGHYTQRTPWWEQVKYILLVCIAMAVFSGAVLYGLKMPFSRLWVICTMLVSPLFLVAGRLIVRKIALAFGHWGTSVAVIGGPENVMETIFALNSDSYNLYKVREVYLLGTMNLLDKTHLPDRQKDCRQHLVRTEDLTVMIAKSQARLVIFAPDEASKLDISDFISQLQKLGKHMAFVPPMTGMSLYGMDVRHFFGSHTVLLQPKRRMKKPMNRFFKRMMDVVGSITGLVLLAIPMLILGLMIRRDGGPVFYAQQRVGRKGRMFPCWKLRSMVPNSKEILENLLATDPQAKAEWEADFKLKNDPRVTKVGNIIRKTSIDELPQLWNVLKGEMSLVGPRPIVTAELDYYGKYREDYMAAKPGLTGLWQVSGRNDTSYAYRVYLDSWYVAHWSFWTDVVIIFKTIGILASRKGAY